MGAEVVFAIEAFGTRVAQVGLTGGGLRLLLAEHLEREAPVLVYRMGDLDTTMAELDRGGLRTESRLGIPHGPCAAFRASGGQRLAVYELTRPRADARLAGRHDSAPGRAEATGSPGLSGAFPRVRSASGRECSPQPGRPTGSASAEERLDQLVLAEMVGHDNHGKISVVQSPPCRRTSWARAGPSGREWKSTKKSRSTSIPPSGWQFTFRSQDRSSG
jgi:hypothetical protein